jgi:hypothetical protein
MKKVMLGCALAIILSGCVIQPSPPPTAQEVAQQIERDYAAAHPTPAPPEPTPAPTPDPNAEVPVSPEARNQGRLTVENLSYDQESEAAATVLDSFQKFQLKDNQSEAAGEMGLLASWIRDRESTGSKQITLSCTDDNIDWFHAIAQNIHDTASLPWTVASKGDSTEQQMAYNDATANFTRDIVEALANKCTQINAAEAQPSSPPPRRRHHHASSSLPKGTHQL